MSVWRWAVVIAHLVALARPFPISSIGCSEPTQQPLAYCNRYSESTCCRPVHDQQILQNVAGLHASTGDESFSPQCIAWTARMACSVCDPRISGPDPIYKEICPSTCRSWFQACHKDLFTSNIRTGLLAPCNPMSLVCSSLSDIFNDDYVAFCARSGFRVADIDSDLCYRGDEPARPAPKPSHSERSERPPPPKFDYRSWFGVAIAVALLLVKRLVFGPARPDPDQGPSNEEIIARRALLVQKWAERNSIDLDNLHRAEPVNGAESAAEPVSIADDDIPARPARSEPDQDPNVPKEPILLNT